MGILQHSLISSVARKLHPGRMCLMKTYLLIRGRAGSKSRDLRERSSSKNEIDSLKLLN